MSQLRVTIHHVEKFSKDLDNFFYQERETNAIATKELKEYVQSKLEKSFREAKRRASPEFIIPPRNYNWLQVLDFNLQKQLEPEKEMSSLYKRTNSKIPSLDEVCLFEALRIIFSQGFESACKYVLCQPIVVVPRPYPGTF